MFVFLYVISIFDNELLTISFRDSQSFSMKANDVIFAVFLFQFMLDFWWAAATIYEKAEKFNF